MKYPDTKDPFKRQRDSDRLIQLTKLYGKWIIKTFKSPWLDAKTQEINRAVFSFRRFEYADRETGLVLKYNLFIPNNFEQETSFPLVTFIHDAGVVSRNPRMTLIQGLGAVIWAAPAEQLERPCFILAPQYPSVIVNDQFQAKPELDTTVNLVKAVARQYNIDQNRLYLTGQSMGCMSSIEIMFRYPDMFAAGLLFAGQWDPLKMAALAQSKLWIAVSENNDKAFQGMNTAIELMAANGAKVSRAFWNGRDRPENLERRAQELLAEGSDINYTVFKDSTVIPKGVPQTSLNNHLYTWELAYAITGFREWLFRQKK